MSEEVWLNTLDPKKNDRQVRSSNFRVCGYKARVVFDMVAHTSKYTHTTFDVEHNHELDRVKYKHLSKVERKLTYNEQAVYYQGLQCKHWTRVFVPFTASRQSSKILLLMLVSDCLKKETAEAYGWLLRAFKKAFVRPPNIVVTDQDGAIDNAVPSAKF
ncbi:hypothetical protein Tco_1184458 [Tanacetum coccineum]